MRALGYKYSQFELILLLTTVTCLEILYN